MAEREGFKPTVLAQAAEKVNQAAEKANVELQAATDKAVAWVQQAAEEATATIVVAIEAANETIVEITQKGIRNGWATPPTPPEYWNGPRIYR